MPGNRQLHQQPCFLLSLKQPSWQQSVTRCILCMCSFNPAEKGCKTLASAHRHENCDDHVKSDIQALLLQLGIGIANSQHPQSVYQSTCCIAASAPQTPASREASVSLQLQLTLACNKTQIPIRASGLECTFRWDPDVCDCIDILAESRNGRDVRPLRAPARCARGVCRGSVAPVLHGLGICRAPA